MNNTTRVILFLTATLLFPLTSYAKVNTQDYWKCTNRTGGNWIFGIAPQACAAKTFISESFVKDKFSPYIFNEKLSSSKERVRYMTEMNHLVVEVAKYYLKKRKSSASNEELEWWTRAVLAITHQESFMTHYRDGKDSSLRMMRGDFGHGHGLMQVDDRHHFTAVDEGRAANLIDNLFYALDIYYIGWQKAPGLSCVKSSTDYYNRARAAYGAYNGGANSACRFKSPTHKFARNDSNFKDKFDGKTWERYISSSQTPQKINVACLSNSLGNSCAGATPAPPSSTPAPLPNLPKLRVINKVLKFRGLLCALENKSYHCISQPEQRLCLVSKYNLVNEVVKTIAVKPVVLLSSEEVCGQDKALFEVGEFIELQKNINMRETPGGLLLTVANSKETYQILDVVVTTDEALTPRYYLIKKGAQKGYIYAGDQRDNKEWSVKTNRADELLIPIKDTVVLISTEFGTNLRQAPGGEKLTVVPNGSSVTVLSTVIVDETNKFYIEVEYQGQRGFLYSGQIHPNYTINDWVNF